MSEHTPLTEAERIERLLEEHVLHAGTSFGGTVWNGDCLAAGCRWADYGSHGGFPAATRAHRRHVSELLAARTSTATERRRPQLCPTCRDVLRYGEDRPDLPPECPRHGDVTSTATADDGLRERVEAALGSYASGQCGAIRALSMIEAALDATAAPTTDTGARDE